MKKRIISMLLAICMLFTLMPAVMVSAADEPIVGLKDAFAKHFKIGTALSASEARKAQAQELTLTHFNSVTCENEMKPDTMLDQNACRQAGDNVSTKVRLTDNTRTILKFCEDNGIPMRGHVFVWHSQTPGWFFRENFDNNGAYVSKEIMDQRLENYFISMFELIETEFPDLEFYAWDIVNEAFTDSNPATMRPGSQSGWVQVYGDDSFIYQAFRFARKHAPEGCKLYYNDYNEYETGKLNAIYALCKNLYEEGVLDGVGMQSHLRDTYPSIQSYRAALDKYASIGCEISVTELDVECNDFESQAKYYEQLFEIYLDYADQIEAVVFWGTMDSVSWRSSGRPLPFDSNYQPKPAYYSIMDTVSDHDHDYVATVVEPTCTEEGYTANVCSICQRTVIKETTEPLGHKWDEGRVTLEPTYTTTGIRTYECERCDATKTSRIRRLGSTVPDNIDFTSMDDFEIENPASAELRDGGLYLVSTTDAFEPCNGQVSTFEPKDVVKISAEGDWIATLKVNFDQGGSQGYYEFLGFYASDDYDNMVGIRGGDNAIQDFIRKGGTVTAETKNATPGLKSASTHWFRIEKAGDSYICYWSTDGETFNEIFSYEETGIIGDTIIIDAYSGMATGYNYILESLEFMDAEGGGNDDECQHDYKAEVTEATCTEGGYTTYTCSKCGNSYKADETEAAGHKWDEGKVTTEPTEDKEGVKTFTCTVCGETKTESIPEKPEEHKHSYEEVVTEPTCTEAGYTTYTCECGHSYTGNEVDALGHDFKDGICTRCDAKDETSNPGEHICPADIFPDVPAFGHWAHEGIDFCVENGLMQGTGSGKFNPGGTLTRAELVTILYRMEGEPKVEYAATFKDVPNDQWYTNAIEWAAAAGVVNGVGDGTNFAPSGVITREQIATILYRAVGAPVVEGDLSAFPDAAKVNSYATDAMLWANQEGIITGAAVNNVTYLNPLNSATREQIASIVMRYVDYISTVPVEITFTVSEDEPIYLAGLTFEKDVTIEGDYGEIFFIGCEFKGDIINTAEEFTRVYILESDVEGKCILKNNTKETTIDAAFPKFLVDATVDVVCEDCFGAVITMGDFEVTFNGKTYSLKDAEYFLDANDPDAGFVPYEGQDASFFYAIQWWEDGEQQLMLACENEAEAPAE
ncbi:MAG: hypothetical protein E7464_03325 [Ruminococcaceae bacterium]|nr:hypothetical protein [Oscillospiraceae bacterium]